MANNPYVNRVETADGSTLMDITDTTAEPSSVGMGEVFYAASGERSVGTFDPSLSREITTPATVQTFEDGSPYPMGMEFEIKAVQSGSGDPSPSNVRPITGWTEANIGVMGKNLLHNVVEADGTTHGQLTLTNKGNGTFSISGTRSNTSNTASGLNGTETFLKAGTYYLSGDAGNDRVYLRVRDLDDNGVTIASIDGVFTIEKDTRIDLALFIRGSTTVSDIIFSPMIEVGETPSTYEPYKGTVYPITFPTSAGTVYGGTVTVNPDGTGTLVVDHGYLDMKTVSNSNINFDTTTGHSKPNVIKTSGVTGRYYAGSEDLKAAFISEGYKWARSGTTSGLRSNLANGECGGQSTVVTIWFRDDRMEDDTLYPTDDDKKNLAKNAAGLVVYPLRAEYIQTFHLSAPQVLALLNQNHVWAETGDIQSLSYVRNTVPEMIRQDTQGQIASAMTEVTDVESALAIVINGDVAPTGGLESGKYVFLKSHSTLARGLYKTTDVIAGGASITENNTEPDSEGGLNSLNDKITDMVIVEQKSITFDANGAGQLSIKTNYVLVAAYPSEWAGGRIEWAFNGTPILHWNSFANQTKTMNLVWLKIS